VINPQNGHITCDPKFLLCGLRAVSSSVNVLVTEASCLRTRLRKRRRTGFIDPPALFLPLRRGLRDKVSGWTALENSGSDLQQLINDRLRHAILCRIAHIAHKHSASTLRQSSILFVPHDESEQFRPALIENLSDHDGRDEHFFSLFRSSELSQPSEVLSS
jgi:hypothetical protein